MFRKSSDAKKKEKTLEIPVEKDTSKKSRRLSSDFGMGLLRRSKSKESTNGMSQAPSNVSVNAANASDKPQESKEAKTVESAPPARRRSLIGENSIFQFRRRSISAVPATTQPAEQTEPAKTSKPSIMEEVKETQPEPTVSSKRISVASNQPNPLENNRFSVLRSMSSNNLLKSTSRNNLAASPSLDRLKSLSKGNVVSAADIGSTLLSENKNLQTRLSTLDLQRETVMKEIEGLGVRQSQMDLVLSNADNSLLQTQEEQEHLAQLLSVLKAKAKQDVELGSSLHISVDIFISRGISARN